MALGTQDFGNQSFTQTLTAYLHLAAELVESAGRADPEPAVALVRLLSILDVAHDTPTAADFVEVFKRAAHVLEKAAFHDMRGNRAPAMSPEILVCYYEAVVTMRLPVHSYLCWERSGITLLVQTQVRASAFMASQAVRLLRAWAALVQATSSGAFRWWPAQVDQLCSCLRPEQLSPAEVEGASGPCPPSPALGAFSPGSEA